MGTENLNPFSAKGRLGFTAFFWTLIVAVVVNLIIYAFIRSALIPSRVAFDKQRIVIFYVTWFISASLGFTVVANTFIKRWADILDERDIGRLLKALFRFSLLSPLLGVPVTVFTMLFFPRSPVTVVGEGGSKASIVFFLVLVLGLSVGVSTVLPNEIFGLERIQFRESTAGFVTDKFNDGRNPMPAESAIKPILAVATPALRYMAWLASDAVRTRMLSVAVESDPNKFCTERLGFLKVEVHDCYFNLLRKMATKVPMVAPYFALYFETEYRKKVMQMQADPTIGSPVERFANSLLLISNMLELLEPGPMFIDRAHLLKPTFLLHAYGSPEFALVEAGQDIQRVTIVEKVLPVIDLQVREIEKMLAEFGSTLGPDEIGVRAELREILIRIQAVRQDPLMLRNFAH